MRVTYNKQRVEEGYFKKRMREGWITKDVYVGRVSFYMTKLGISKYGNALPHASIFIHMASAHHFLITH